MTYESTRGSKEKVTFSQAVVAGLAPDGGLFVPCGDVRFGENELAEMAGLDYCGLAFKVMSRYTGALQVRARTGAAGRRAEGLRQRRL